MIKHRSVFIALSLATCLAATTALAGGSKAFRGQVDDPQVTDFLAFTTTGGGGGTAGMVLEVEAKIEGLGGSVVNIDSSWHWSPGPYAPRHPCALVDHVPSSPMPDFISGDPDFVYQSEVTITAANGDQVVGDIKGGSVCEIVVFGPAQSINQWLIAFEVDGLDSTGRFAGRAGQGVIDFKFDSRPDVFDFVQPFQLSLNLD